MEQRNSGCDQRYLGDLHLVTAIIFLMGVLEGIYFPWSSQGREEMLSMPHWESTQQDQCCSCVFALLSALFQGCPGVLWLLAG